MVRRMGGGAEGIVRGLCRGQAEAERARLRRPPALLGADGRRRRPGRRHRRPLRSRPGRRVSGHEPPAVLDPAGAQARRPRPDGGRRRRPIDLFVPRRDRAQHPRLSRPVLAACEHHHARPQLSLDANDPRRRQRRHRPRQGALHQEPLDRTDVRQRSRNSSRSATRPTRRASSSNASWRTASPARSSKSRPCCSGHPATAVRSKSN